MSTHVAEAGRAGAGPGDKHGAGTGASLHWLGVVCGLAAGVWLGAAEAPTKLVTVGLSPYTISLCMVAGVFTARWTFPTLLKGTSFVFTDLAAKRHLILWAILAGGLWAVGNTLTIVAIRDVGLATAFPLWNTNSLVGLLWARLLFGELKGADGKNVAKVLLGAVLIVVAAIMLGFSTIRGQAGASPAGVHGMVAAGGASLMWGTMYVCYRKAYISGLNPLSFVTAFTVGELLTMGVLAYALGGRGAHGAGLMPAHATQLLFWLFLGGFCWVVGDLFQQFAAKYLGIGRGIPLSNTNQLWGLAWGALVFGELRAAGSGQRWLVLGGSLLMIAGAFAVSTAVASAREVMSSRAACERECDRYGLDYWELLRAQGGEETTARTGRRRWWDYAIVLGATAVFVWLAAQAVVPPLALDLRWLAALGVVLVVALVGAGMALWRSTQFT